MEVTLGCVVDDSLQLTVIVECRASPENLIRFVAQAVEKQRVNSCRFFTDQPASEARSCRGLAGRAQAAKKFT
jgi:hypothetical protein